jgi:hypothetical protein
MQDVLIVTSEGGGQERYAMMRECVEFLQLTQAVNHPRTDSTLLRRIRSTRPTWMLHPLGEYNVHTGYCRNLAVGVVGYTVVEGGR